MTKLSEIAVLMSTVISPSLVKIGLKTKIFYHYAKFCRDPFLNCNYSSKNYKKILIFSHLSEINGSCLVKFSYSKKYMANFETIGYSILSRMYLLFLYSVLEPLDIKENTINCSTISDETVFRPIGIQ